MPESSIKYFILIRFNKLGFKDDKNSISKARGFRDQLNAYINSGKSFLVGVFSW